MGLGKTIQTIAFLAWQKERRKISGPHLIVAPNTTLGNWFNELRKWLPNARVIKLYARKEYREEIFEKYLKKGSFDIVITSYEGINICKRQLIKFNWKYIIIDEAHRLKNEASLLSKNLRDFETNQKLLITGTPLQNNLHELWSLQNFLLPDLFDSSDIFDYWFNINSQKNSTGSGSNDKDLSVQELEQKNMEIITALHRVQKPFILRRTKADLDKALPPKKEIHLYVGLSELQCGIYKNILMKKPATEDKKIYANVLMQLRKCCNHPYLFDGAEEEDAPILGDHIQQNSGKQVVLAKQLEKLFGGHQVLIFSQMTSMLNILEDFCNYMNYKYCRIDGDTFIDEREAAIEDFVRKDSDKFIFLLSTRAGGLGINLATADTVIIYDSDWNPQVDLQAMDRAHRIGQVNPVNVYRLITENSIEEKIIERQKIKLKWDSQVVQKGKLQEKNKGMNKDELKNQINFGASEVFKAEGGTISDEDIEAQQIRGEERTKLITDEINKQVENQASLLDLGIGSLNIYQFEGSDYIAKKREDEAALETEYLKNLEKNLGSRRSLKTDPFVKNIPIKEPKIIKLPEYLFYEDREKLLELLTKEAEFKANVSFIRKVEYEFDDGLPRDQHLLKERLQQTGFSDWSKQEFNSFQRACERFGRDNFQKISELIGSKTKEQVQTYSEVFWQRINEQPDSERIINNIRKGENGIEARKHASELLEDKCKSLTEFENQEFRDIIYNKYKSKIYTPANDKFLVFMSNKLGYGNNSEIKMNIRKEDLFKFDHFFKSRSEGDLSKRITTQLKMLKAEKEHDIDRQKKIEEGLIDPITGKPPISKKINEMHVDPENGDPNQVIRDGDTLHLIRVYNIFTLL